jgi:hypothetical protein
MLNELPLPPRRTTGPPSGGPPRPEDRPLGLWGPAPALRRVPYGRGRGARPRKGGGAPEGGGGRGLQMKKHIIF